MTRIVARTALTLALASAAAAAPRAQLGIFKRGGAVTYQEYKDPSGRFSLEYPAKDWRTTPAGGSVLVGFSQKDGEASILVDYMRLRVALAPADIGQMFADLEVQTLKERQPAVKDVKSSLTTGASGPRVVLQFAKPGSRSEQVTQYSIPVGADLYRLVSTIRADKSEKNAPILAHIVDSFTTGESK